MILGFLTFGMEFSVSLAMLSDLYIFLCNALTTLCTIV